jgi:hypothetical protein
VVFSHVKECCDRFNRDSFFRIMLKILNTVIQIIIKRAILVLVGVCCYFYIRYASDFAELHIQLPQLNFPIFIGEILLLLCVLLLIIYFLKFPVRFHLRWLLLGGFYLLWILLKAYLGYQWGGPLALRHAALFYYPVFMFVGYVAFDRNIYSRLGRWILLAFVFFNLFFVGVNEYFVVIFFMLALGLSLQIRQRYLCLLGILLCVFYVLHSGVLWWNGRSHMVGVGVMAIFLSIYFLFGMFKSSRRIKLLSLFVLTVVFVILLFKFGDQNALKSMLTFRALRQQYSELDLQIRRGKEFYIQAPLTTKVYHENLRVKESYRQAPLTAKVYHENLRAKSQLGGVVIEPISKLVNEELVEGGSQLDIKKSSIEKSDLFQNSNRRLDIAYSNIFFRLFIWRDMWDDFLKQNAWWLGVSFGQPQRSSSLEILDWAPSEWQRDGWITPHNSFFHMIYRGGLVGLFGVIMIFGLLINMTQRFLRLHSVWGGLLVACMVYWVTISNFLVFLELPYNAIPFWFLGGMTLAYLHALEKDSGRESHLTR